MFTDLGRSEAKGKVTKLALGPFPWLGNQEVGTWKHQGGNGSVRQSSQCVSDCNIVIFADNYRWLEQCDFDANPEQIWPGFLRDLQTPEQVLPKICEQA